MKNYYKIIIISILSMTLLQGQTFADISGGVYDNDGTSLHMLVGLSHYQNNIGLSARYRNLTGNGEFYEGRLHYDMGILDISAGVSYEYANGGFYPLVGVSHRIYVTELLQFDLGVDHMLDRSKTMFNVGVRIKLTPYRGKREHRFF